MPGRARKAMNGAEEPSGNDVEVVELPTEYSEAEKDTQQRIDALKGDDTDGHFHTRQPHDVFKGVCHGGPMDGMEGVSRYPKGFVLMDPADSRAWVYDRHGEGYVARAVEPLDSERAKKAANEANYDVRAYDVETMKRH